MFDLSRMTRLLTLALASCAVTWAFAAGALANPAAPDEGTTGAAPAFKDVAGDADSPTVATRAPAFKDVAGDADQPSIGTRAPAFKVVAGDTAKTPDPAQVARVLNGIGRGKAGPVAAPDRGGNDAEWFALALSILAIVTALAAASMTMHRPRGRTLGA